MPKLSSLKLCPMDRHERIAKAIKASGKQKQQIANECGVSGASVSQWISGESKSMKPENLFALAKATGFRAEWLAIGVPPERDGEPDAVMIGDLSPWDDSTPLDDDEVELPLYKEVELAAGSGRTTVQEVPGRKLRFSYATLRATGVDPAAAVCAKLKGNSMEPLIMDGSTVGIDTATTHITDGEIYALEHDGMLRVKYLYRLPGGGTRLRSFNRAEYEDEDYTPEQLAAANIRVIGWIFWWSTVRPRRSFRR